MPTYPHSVEGIRAAEHRIAVLQDRRDQLAVVLERNVSIAVNFREAAHLNRKRLDFHQAASDAQCALEHREFAKQAAIQIRALTARIDLETRSLRLMSLDNGWAEQHLLIPAVTA